MAATPPMASISAPIEMTFAAVLALSPETSAIVAS
jgi:hypothetical protein